MEHATTNPKSFLKELQRKRELLAGGLSKPDRTKKEYAWLPTRNKPFEQRWKRGGHKITRNPYLFAYSRIPQLVSPFFESSSRICLAVRL